MVYPWKIIREEPTSYTYPSFWLSPKCKVVIEPTSIFNLPDSANCFHERTRNSTIFIEVAGDWEGPGEDLPIFELIYKDLKESWEQSVGEARPWFPGPPPSSDLLPPAQREVV